jgi:prevent-host-death family protein
MSVNLKEDIRPISYVKTNAADMMKYIEEHRNPIIITQNGEAKAALIDITSYQEMQDAFSLLKIVRLAERDITSGRVRPASEVLSEMKKKLQNASE